jgi:hypothetical protein
MKASGKEKPSIGYVGAASGDNAAFRLMVTGFLKAAGSGEVLPVRLTGKRFNRNACLATLGAVDLVYLSGGDVEEGMRVLAERDLIEPLRKIREAGVPFFSHSAGSIMLAREWVRWPDPDDDASAEIFPCLGYAPLICDTHGEGEGWEELKALVALEKEGVIGYGLRSGSSVSASVDGGVAVIGGVVDRFVKRNGAVVPMESLAAAGR